VKYLRSIPVEDASGLRFEVHEYHQRRLFYRLIKFTLDTGEEVRRLDANTFVVVTTGETLMLSRS
jgi:hypothetical protein